MDNFDESKLRVWLSVHKSGDFSDGITIYYPNKKKYIIWGDILDEENTLYDINTTHYDYELRGCYGLTQEDLDIINTIYEDSVVCKFIYLQYRVADEVETAIRRIKNTDNMFEEN